MKSTGLFARELHRLLHSRPAWLALLLTLLSPLAGLFLYKPATADTMLSLYLANPPWLGARQGGSFLASLPYWNWTGSAAAGWMRWWMRRCRPCAWRWCA